MIRPAFTMSLIFALALPLLGCSQRAGGVCQVNGDCADGLVCNAGTQQCQERGTVTIDAGQPADASQRPDAATIDAASIDAASADANNG
jgi:hypothetical protein